MFYLIGLVLIFAARLWIWKLFPGLESALKDDLSNMIVASLIFGLAVPFFMRQWQRREGLPASSLEGPLALYTAAAALSMAWTTDVASTVRSLVMLTAYLLYFYMLLQALMNPLCRRIFIWAFFAGAVVVAGFGINDIVVLSRISPEELEAARLTNKSLYYILTHKRACSLFGWPNVLAGFLMLAMPLAAALALCVRQHWLKAVVAFGLVMMIAAFFLTFSFLGWSGFLLTLAGLFGWLIHRRMLSMPAIAGRYVAAGVCVAVILFTGVILKKDFGGSITPRREYARVVHAVIMEHPWKGKGFGAYRAGSMKFVVNREGETAFAHNAYAQIWAETGVPGLLAVLWLVVAALLYAGRTWPQVVPGPDKAFFMAAMVGLLAFFVDNINSFTILKPNVSFFFWSWLAFFCSYGPARTATFPSSVRARRRVMIIMGLVAATGLFLSVRSALSLSAVRAGREALQAGVVDLARGLFDKAHLLDPVDPRALTARGDLALRRFNATRASAWLDEAEAFFVKAATLAPYDYYNFFVLSSIYHARGDRIRGAAALRRAREISPYETASALETFSRSKQDNASGKAGM